MRSITELLDNEFYTLTGHKISHEIFNFESYQLRVAFKTIIVTIPPIGFVCSNCYIEIVPELSLNCP